jgi:hypothetical protein
MSKPYYRTHFESLGDFLKASRLPSVSGAKSSKREGRNEEEFSGTRNFEQALDLAEKGWPEGRKKLMTAMATAQSSPTFTPAITMDVAGAYPIAALAAAGDPCSMVDLAPVEDRVRPVVRLLIQRAGSAAYSVDEFMSYGAAIMSYIEGLEGAGFRCEITLCFASNLTSDGDQCLTVLVKRAEEPIELDRMAFVMVHPAMFRRICFAVYETIPGLSQVLDNNGYGYSRNPRAEEAERGQCIIPGINSIKPGNKALKTPAACLKHIGPVIEEQLRQAGVEPPAQAFGGASE